MKSRLFSNSYISALPPIKSFCYSPCFTSSVGEPLVISPTRHPMRMFQIVSSSPFSFCRLLVSRESSVMSISWCDPLECSPTMCLGDRTVVGVLPFCICNISEGRGIPWLDGLMPDICNNFHPFQSDSLIVFARLPFFCMARPLPGHLLHVHLGGGDISSSHLHPLLTVLVHKCVWDD